MLQNVIRSERERFMFRSAAQVRGDLLFKLGVPPSPQVGYGTGTGSAPGSRQTTPGFIGNSPALIGARMLARIEEKRREKEDKTAFKAKSGEYKRTNSMSPRLGEGDKKGGKKKKKKGGGGLL